jgi:hypothetical protein
MPITDHDAKACELIAQATSYRELADKAPDPQKAKELNEKADQFRDSAIAELERAKSGWRSTRDRF